MRLRPGFFIAVVLALAAPAWSQRPGEQRPGQRPDARAPEQRAPEQRTPEQRAPEQRPEEGDRAPRANHGRIPDPPQHRDPRTKPEPERIDRYRVNSVPHVDNGRWYGHDRPDDRRFHVDRPFEHGRFEHFGPQFRYSVIRFEPGVREFWLPGGYFQVADWDWPMASGWCWHCGDDFVVYEDPDHPGWYLVYNLHTGVYVHALFMGR